MRSLFHRRAAVTPGEPALDAPAGGPVASAIADAAPPPRADPPALGLLAAATLLYTGVNLYRLAHFYPLDYDLAIFGQGLWLLSRGATPFVTIRGMNLFGEHATFIHLALVPVYALLGPPADVRLLVLLQSAALGGAGLLLFLEARRELGRRLARLVLLSYLVYPALQHTWLEYYEPINLSVPCLLAAVLAVRAGRDRSALLWSLAALATLESVAATVFAIGLYAALRGRRRLGTGLMAGASLYVAALMLAVFPWLNEGGYVYGPRLYGDFARSLPGAVGYLARPDHLLLRLATAENGRYLLGLLAPVAFLPLLAPGTLALAAQLPLNMVSSWPYAHQIRYHYVAPILPFVFLAVIRGLARLRAGSLARRAAVLALAAGLVAGSALHGSPWIVPGRGPVWWRGWAADGAERRDVEALLDRIPPRASLSVHYRFLPRLCERPRLYLFPDTGPPGTWPDALVVDEPLLAGHPRDEETWERARSEGGFREVARTPRGTVLLVRHAAFASPPGALAPSSPPPGRPEAAPR